MPYPLVQRAPDSGGLRQPEGSLPTQNIRSHLCDDFRHTLYTDSTHLKASANKRHFELVEAEQTPAANLAELVAAINAKSPWLGTQEWPPDEGDSASDASVDTGTDESGATAQTAFRTARWPRPRSSAHFTENRKRPSDKPEKTKPPKNPGFVSSLKSRATPGFLVSATTR